MIDNVESGSLVTAAKFNEIKSGVDALFSVITVDYYNHATGSLFPFDEQDGKRDNTQDSLLAFMHKHKYLKYAMNNPKDTAQIIDPSGASNPIQLPSVEVGEVGEYDLSSVSWLQVGMLYYVRKVLWALELQKGDYVHG